MSSTERESAIAAEIGRYHVIAQLGRGGMGNVYLAAFCGPASFHKLLAVKELKPELSKNETCVAMFLEEARLAARLVHPNIVQLNEVSSDFGRYYMVMEYVDGRSVARLMARFARDGGFPPAGYLRVLADALQGLHYAHEFRGFTGEPFGIVHRDISPLNLMVTFDGQAKLLDFGIAKAHNSSLETKAGVLKGRIAYMAPEQAYGAPVDRRADIYSFGVMLWEGMAGRRLWPQLSEVEILSRVLRDEPPRLRDVVPDISWELDAICARAMAKDGDDRYATAAELLEDLESHLAHRADRMTMRQVGDLVSAKFADERRRMNQLIEQRLSDVSFRAHSRVTPVFPTDVSTSSSAASPTGDEPYRAAEWITLPPDEVHSAALWSEIPTQAEREVVVAGVPRSHATTEIPVAMGEAQPPVLSRRVRLSRVVAAAALLLLLASTWGSDRAARRRGSSADGSAKPAGSIRATPAGAAVIDPAPWVPLPATGTLGPAESAPPAPKLALHETAKSLSASSASPAAAAVPVASASAGVLTIGNQIPARPTPEAVSPAEDHPSTPEGCDPPYMVDSKGIEHFKAVCL
jgi:serine/threonine protein kinase